MKLEYFVVATLLIYMPFHFFEEALGNFPQLMYQHKWMPEKLSLAHWMGNNIFIFYPLLLLSLIVYLLGGKTTICFGIGILVWGLINSVEHFFYCIKDRKAEPGIITSFVFLVCCVSGIYIYVHSEYFNAGTMALSVLVGIALFAAAIFLCITVGKFFKKHFA